MGDHHLTHDHYIQVMPTISNMAAFSGDMQLLPLFLLPFYNPILLAEQVATLDVITGGRTVVICGLGYDPAAFSAFGTSQRVRAPRFVETFRIMRALFTGDDVTFRGRHYNIDEGVRVNPKPVQQPLPMWIAGGADPALRRAARIADGWVIAPGWNRSTIERGLQVYRNALAEFGREDEGNEVVLRRDVHLAGTNEAARREAEPLFENGYRGMRGAHLEESLFAGGPGECVEYLKGLEGSGALTGFCSGALWTSRNRRRRRFRCWGKGLFPRLGRERVAFGGAGEHLPDNPVLVRFRAHFLNLSQDGLELFR